MDYNKQAISDRGLDPLNYNLLNDEDIKATIPVLECRDYLCVYV